VELHFRKEHTVAAYAAMLNKSPKTLSNYFLQRGTESPLHIVQERIMLEGRRLLRYSDKSVKEIAYEIGYEDVQAFSRAFRQKEGTSPSEFREEKIK
jgi:AraC family transcriptional regulator, transcriptional activator of pobA